MASPVKAKAVVRCHRMSPWRQIIRLLSQHSIDKLLRTDSVDEYSNLESSPGLPMPASSLRISTDPGSACFAGNDAVAAGALSRADMLSMVSEKSPS